jgi:tetratricopeptide (TPR) repeat protein
LVISLKLLYLVRSEGHELDAMVTKAGESAAIFFLVLSSFAANVVAPTTSELENMYSAAAQELDAGHYREALKKLDAIDARQPDMAAAQNLRGVAWMRLAEYRKAETALRKAREIDPDFWEARFNLAEVPFLTQDWTEARRRFTALAAEPNDHLDGATSDFLRFKILLTFLLEDKEKMGASILAKIKASPEGPAFYYAQAALALRHQDRQEAKSWMAKAAKEFSPQLNKLFAESFYEVGWLPKPEGANPVALEVTSPTERLARAQTDLARAERAYRRRDLEEAWQLLDQVDATSPSQAVTYNLRGEILLDQGKTDEAETALRNALAADPQLLAARYNLARVPFAKKDYATARKELEALLGAISGGKERQRERLVRYQIFLTLLLEGHEGAAQKAMDEFKMMDDSPALYYAQAAWAFQHGNPKQGNNWVANASNLYSAELNRAFAAPFSDLGWVSNATAPSGAAMPSPGVVQNVSAKAEATSDSAAILAKSVENVSSLPAVAQSKPIAPAPSPKPTPEVSATPEKVADVKKSRKKSSIASTKTVKKKRATPKKSTNDDNVPASRSGQTVSSERATVLANSPPVALPTPAEVSQPRRQNLGDKVVRALLYPFRHRGEKASVPPVAGPTVAPSMSVSPTPLPRGRPNN